MGTVQCLSSVDFSSRFNKKNKLRKLDSEVMSGRINGDCSLQSVRRGAWTAEEDRKLEEYVEMHGSKKWKSLAVKAGLNRCGKSCRLRWLNYLQPGIKRGNMSDAEEDLILRLHRLLGNRWSLIARRIPGRTDNEIKNYWNTHLRKKAKLMEKLPVSCFVVVQHNRQHDKRSVLEMMEVEDEKETSATYDQQLRQGDDIFDFSDQRTYGLEWVETFLQLEQDTSGKTNF